MSNLTFGLALVGAVLGALSSVLHLVGVRSPKAEKLAEDVDAVKDVIPKVPADGKAAPHA